MKKNIIIYGYVMITSLPIIYILNKDSLEKPKEFINIKTNIFYDMIDQIKKK